MTPGRDARDELVAELWAERFNGIAWKQGRNPTRPPATHSVDTRTAYEFLEQIPVDDDIATARRRRELLAAVDHTTHESEAQ